MTAGSSVKTRELLLAVATRELENRIFQVSRALAQITMLHVRLIMRLFSTEMRECLEA